MRPLRVHDAWQVSLRPHFDERGTFVEWFKQEPFEQATGQPPPLAQANVSVSRRGVIRGVHFVDVPPGQAKWVCCLAGEILDMVVDVRVGSPTFGQFDAVRLGGGEWKAVYLSAGLGHAFMALTDEAIMAYLCSEPYVASRERTINALGSDPALPWPTDLDWIVSPKDVTAPTLREAMEAGLLPNYADCALPGARLPGAEVRTR
ncbi:dTDP-4-dehydrorhamnose 3,5-epimerase [Actinomadura sp. ATCC 31491]|uniref:dTDP-4-dehydrorhamnose 3,5-epimerase n=1 Tax=Actinomadura luzonensis TaxID=2805427 RepID=A0ABT0G936_9ACTN|nr:dTDP-4-dehydrorhamnose 3,5-epimerase [Actinomadura luzonensis]MCK2221110.1 dTDP-4-dehydrorhamnose 3,5-epimerase [Actinomadura luzonensis]